MRNNDTGLGILLNKFREVCDPLLVEIVGRLVEQQQVGILNESRGEQKPCLLTAGE